jgi:predicted DNA-binding transcriptional regulator YafY
MREQARAVQENLVFNALPRTSAPVGPTLVTLSLGAQHHRTVWLRYRNWRGEESERQLDPYRLVNHAGRWYIIGWCHLRHSIRVFRLERIEEVKLEEETFTPPADFDPLSHLEKALASTPYRWEVEVLLKTSLTEAQARVPGEFGLLEVAKEGVLMRARVEGLGEMARFLIWLGFEFELIKPAELRQELLDMAAKIVASAEAPKS